MTDQTERVVVAYFEPHVYVRVGLHSDDEGRVFNYTDGPLLATIRKAAEGAKGKVQNRRLYVVRSPHPASVTATVIFNAVVELPQYHWQLVVPDHEKPGIMVFCAADRSLADLQLAAEGIRRHVSSVEVEITWPYLAVLYKPGRGNEIDAESASCAELNLPPGQRNTLWDLDI